MTDAFPAKTIIPVGLDLGVNYRGDAPAAEPLMLVRADGGSRPLEPTQYKVWTLAHHVASEDGTPWSRSQIVESAMAAGAPDAAQALEGLLSMGLLFELTPATDDTMRFASVVRLLPRVAGLGVTRESHPLVMVGVAGSPVGAVPAGVYDILAWGSLDRSLLEACERSALRARERGMEEPGRIDPRTLLEHFLYYAPNLIAVGALRFDFIRSVEFSPSARDQEAVSR